jgi:hypothetical protein
MYDSLKILGLGLGASEREVKLAYHLLPCIYHPDKWERTHQNSHSYDSTFKDTYQPFLQKRFTFLLLVFHFVFLAHFEKRDNFPTVYSPDSN